MLRQFLNYKINCSPFKWWHPFSRSKLTVRTPDGILRKMSAEQIASAYTFAGPVAHGKDGYPKLTTAPKAGE